MVLLLVSTFGKDMDIIYANDYEEMSSKGTELLCNTIQNKKDAVICLATGGSPRRMYELFVERINQEQIDISQVTFVKLDEWAGVEPQEACTCTTFIQKEILSKLHQQPKAFIEIPSNAPHLEEELHKLDVFLQEHPIDVMILGLGMNGHLGLNEPAEELVLQAHRVRLSEVTKGHDMVKGKVLNEGFTIGLQGIFQARKVLMLVSGDRKQQAYEAFMSQKITTKVPASLLWLHSDCVTIIDKAQFGK